MSSLLVTIREIKDIQPHPYADKLELVTIDGWTIVSQKDLHKKGDTVIYVPPDSILPLELSERLGVTKYLSKQRVKSVKLRGIISCGLIIKNEGNWPLGHDLSSYYGIAKYEPPEPDEENIKEPEGFDRYTDIENWNNYPNVFKNNEEVVITEKIHGTNFRCGLINNNFYVGSHHCTKAYNEKNLYWQIAIKHDLENKIKNNFDPDFNWMFYGEIFGKVQDLKYGLNNNCELRLFDISQSGEYLNTYDNLNYILEASKILEVPAVPILYQGPYSIDLIDTLCQGQAFQGNHIREGIVIKPVVERLDPTIGRVILKKINPEYLVRKDGTEYH